jgi:hypothetical protein
MQRLLRTGQMRRWEAIVVGLLWLALSIGLLYG